MTWLWWWQWQYLLIWQCWWQWQCLDLLQYNADYSWYFKLQSDFTALHKLTPTIIISMTMTLLMTIKMRTRTTMTIGTASMTKTLTIWKMMIHYGQVENCISSFNPTVSTPPSSHVIHFLWCVQTDSEGWSLHWGSASCGQAPLWRGHPPSTVWTLSHWPPVVAIQRKDKCIVSLWWPA